MVIGICGYGYTGTGAVFSLLKEFDKVRCLSGGRDDIEFTLSYVPDGLEDLEYHLCINPTKGVGCDSAIYRFQLLVNDFERSHNRFTNNRFREISNNYINELVQVKYSAFRIFEYERNTSSSKRISRLIRNYLRIIFRKFGIDYTFFPKRERYISIFPDDFLSKTKIYINEILGSDDNRKCILLNQPFSVTNPLHSMRFFEEPYCIIVDRDPRDLYVMAKHIYGSYAKFIPTESIYSFVNYYKRLYDRRLIQDNSKILRIQFEDLIYHYEETLSIIQSFLGNDIGNHVNKLKLFNPKDSRKNTNIYNSFNEDDNIHIIESELSEWLYKFDETSIIKPVDDLRRFTLL